MTSRLSGSAVGSVANRRPVFISSLYRSSSTFVAAVLSCHPKYFAMSSAVKYLRFCYGKYCPIYKEKNVNTLIQETYCRVSKRWDIQFDLDLAKEIGIANGGGYAGFYDGIMTAILHRYAEKELEWTEKIAVMWSGIPAFLNMFPNGKVLHIHRDPRSVMASYKKMTNEPGYAYLDTIFNFISSVQHIKEYKKKYGDSRIMEIRSEDLAANPECVLQEMCNFLDIEFASSMLDPNKYALVLGEQWNTNTSFRGKIIGFPKPHEKWREFLEPNEILFLETLTQPYLSELGYGGMRSGYPEAFDSNFKSFTQDEYIGSKLETYIKTGLGAEGYRSDPWMTEMKIVFPEKFEKSD